MNVSDDVMYGQRRISIYDQLDEIQVFNDTDDETQVCNDLVNYTVLSSTSALSDQPAQQAERRSRPKWVMLFKNLYASFLIFNIFYYYKVSLVKRLLLTALSVLCLLYRSTLYLGLVLTALIILFSVTVSIIIGRFYGE